jgi:two-component system, LytTR family, sensor kinase
MEIALGALLGAVLVASLFAGLRLLSTPQGVLSGEGRAMQAALHAATATLPHLRRGLSESTAAKAVPHLRALTQASVLAIADRQRLLAVDGPGAVGDFAGRPVSALFEHGSDDRVSVDRRLDRADLHLGGAVVAPLIVRGRRIGSLAAFYARGKRIRPEDTRVVADAAALVTAQVELAAIEEQEERLAQAELRALRAQISPHFVYNALAAVASYIHSRPEEARELLTDFAEFTRYAFRRERPYVTLADELHYVEKYLNLERARFGDRLEIRLEVAPEVLQTILPVLSLQPLVENAVRHGVEGGEGVRIEVVGSDLGADTMLRVRDDGGGMTAEEARAALEGRTAGIGLSNVHRRLRSSFGPEYGLAIDSTLGEGTEVRLVAPKFHPGVRAA